MGSFIKKLRKLLALFLVVTATFTSVDLPTVAVDENIVKGDNSPILEGLPSDDDSLPAAEPMEAEVKSNEEVVAGNNTAEPLIDDSDEIKNNQESSDNLIDTKSEDTSNNTHINIDIPNEDKTESGANTDDSVNEEDVSQGLNDDLDNDLIDDELNSKLLKKNKLLKLGANDEPSYSLMINGNSLPYRNSDGWYEIAYDSSVSFSAKVDDETYESGIDVLYSKASSSIGTPWGGVPSVGQYYLKFRIPSQEIIPEESDSTVFKLKVIDSVNPVISDFSPNESSISIAGYDSGSGLVSYALSTGSTAPEVSAWENINSDGSPVVGESGFSVSYNASDLEVGIYYLYIKDGSGNIAKSSNAISISKLIINNYYLNSTKTDYVKLFVSRAEDGAISEPLPATDRARFDFGGYYDNSDFSGTAITGNATISAGSLVEYYGKWTLKGVEFANNLSDYEKVYDGQVVELKVSLKDTYSSVVWNWYKSNSPDGDFVDLGVHSSSLSVKNVANSGYYKAVATITEDGEVSEVSSEVSHVVITKRPVNITIDNQTITYGSDPSAFTISVAASTANTGFVGDDTITSVFGASYSNSITTTYRNDGSQMWDIGVYPITGEGLSADNYQAQITNGFLTVNALPVDSSMDIEVNLEGDSFEYTGEAIEPQVNSVSVKLSGKAPISLNPTDYQVSYDGNINVGNGTVVITFNKNFTGEYRGKTFEITKATYSANTVISHDSWFYGEKPEDLIVNVNNNYGGTVTYYYLKKGNESSFETANKSNATTIIPENAGDYYVWGVISETTNYQAVTANPTEFTIKKRVIIIESASATWNYDGITHTAGDYTQSGTFVEGEGFHSVVVTGSVKYVTEGEVTNDITYKLTSATNGDNYDIRLNKGILKVEKAKLPTLKTVAWTSTPGNIQWTAITRDGLNIRYALQLYRNENGENIPVGEPIVTAETRADLKDYIIADTLANGIAGYTVTVKTVIDEDSNGIYLNYTESDDSIPLALKYTAMLKVEKNGGDEGVNEYYFKAPVNNSPEINQKETYLLQGQKAAVVVTYNTGYETPSEAPVFNYTKGDSGFSTSAYSGDSYTVTFTNGELDGLVDGSIVVKSKDSAPICNEFRGSQAADYSYVSASIAISDLIGLKGYKIVKSVSNISDDNWITIDQVGGKDVKEFSTTVNLTEAGDHYLVFKDNGGNIRYCESPITIYSIKFKKGNEHATGTMPDIYKLKDATVVLPTHAFQYAGYVFTNWTTDAAAILPENASYVKNTSAVMTAGWTNKKYTYTVNYYYEKLTENGDEVTVAYGDSPDESETYSCSYDTTVNYCDSAIKRDKDGWSITDNPAGIEDYNPTINVTEDDLQLDVYYKLNKYTMTYSYTDYNNLVVTIENEFYYNQTFTELTKPSRTGYDFMGWNYGDIGSKPEKMPAANISATGYFHAQSTQYIIRYYLQNINYQDKDNDYLAFSFSAADGTDDYVSADYGTPIHAYISGHNKEPGVEVVTPKEISGFTPEAVKVTYKDSVAYSFDSKIQFATLVKNGDNSSDLTHSVYSAITEENTEGTQEGPTIVSFYYTRNVYNLSMDVYQGNRDDGIHLFGSYFDGKEGRDNDEASWRFPFGYAFAPEDSEDDLEPNIFKASYFETYGYDSEGFNTYENGKTHSAAWTKRWEGEVTADKYYLANFIDWSSGSRPSSMPAGNVKVVREYASREQSIYRVELYVESITTQVINGVTCSVPGPYVHNTTFERYSEAGRTITVSETGENTDTNILISSLMEGVDSKQHYHHDEATLSNEVLQAQVKENLYDNDNNLIDSDESIMTLKVYMTLNEYPVNVNYYYRDIDENSGNYSAQVKIGATETFNQKWGTTYSVDPEKYFYSNDIGKAFYTDGYSISDYWHFTSPSRYSILGYAGGHGDYTQYSRDENGKHVALTDPQKNRQIKVGVSNNYVNIWYNAPADQMHYFLKLTYHKYVDGVRVSGETPLTYNLDGVDYQVCAANKSDIFDSNGGLKAGFTEHTITYSGSDINTPVSGKFYTIDGDNRAIPLIFTTVDDNKFYIGNLVYFIYNNVPAHIGRENFDAEENKPSDTLGVASKHNNGNERIETSGSINPIDGTSGTNDKFASQNAYYFDFTRDFKLTYIFDGKSRVIDYDKLVTVQPEEIGKDLSGNDVFQAGEGYEIVWYKDSSYNEVADDPILLKQGVTLFGKRYKKPLENIDITYYELPEGGYYTGSLDDLYSETESVYVTYTYEDGKTTVNKSGQFIKYYKSAEEKILYVGKKSHYSSAFSEINMDYGSYVTSGFKHDEKNTSNVLSGFCGSKPISLRSYYARTSAKLVIRRNDSTNSNDEESTWVNGRTVAVSNPSKMGYIFTGWTLYDYTGGVKGEALAKTDYKFVWDEINKTATFSMPICDTLLEANWAVDNIPLTIVHLYQDNTKTYNLELYKNIVADTLPANVISEEEGNITYYYIGEKNINNLAAAIESVAGVKSEDIIKVEDHENTVGSMFTYATGTYEHVPADSGDLTLDSSFTAYWDAKVTLYYSRESSIVITANAYCLDSSSETGLSNVTGITLSGAGNYYYGQSATLYATMQPTGYDFIGWYRVNDGTVLTEEQLSDLSNLIETAGTENAVLTLVETIPDETNIEFTAFESESYIVVTRANPAVKPTITITIDRDLDTEPLYYNYKADAKNQFNAKVDWGIVDASANNIKMYKWYYYSPSNMDDASFEELDLDTISTDDMTYFENSNTSTFNLPTKYNAGYYVLRCVAEVERKDNGRTETAQGSYKFKILPDEGYLVTKDSLNNTYSGQEYTYEETWNNRPSDYSIYYSKQPFTIGEDIEARLTSDGDDRVYTSKPKYRDVIVDTLHNPIPHVVYYYVESRDPNYASITGEGLIEIKPYEVTVTAVRSFTKIYDGVAEVCGKPEEANVGEITYKYHDTSPTEKLYEDDDTYSDFYRLQSGIDEVGATAKPYYRIDGILSADKGKTMMLNFDATFDSKHVDDVTTVTLENVWVLSLNPASDLHDVYENWNYVFPKNMTLKLSGQIKPYPLDIKWLPKASSEPEQEYEESDFAYNYTGRPQAPYIKVVGNADKIPDSPSEFSVSVTNKQTNAGTYSAQPAVEAKAGANYNPTDYTFTLENKTYKILPRYIKVYPKNIEKVYNGANQTMVDSNEEFRFETKETADGDYVEYNLPATEHYNVTATKSYKNAGSYNDVGAAGLSIYTMTGGVKNVITDNYVIEYGTGTLTINPCPVVVSGITGVDKEYDGTTAADLNISSAVIRLQADNTKGIYSGDNLVLDTAGSPGSFDTPYVGSDKLVTIQYGGENGIIIKKIGSYGNYVIAVADSQSETAANIVKSGKIRAVIKGNDSEIVYGTTVEDDFFTYSITGMVSGESVGAKGSGSDIECEAGYPTFSLMVKNDDGTYSNAVGENYTFKATDSLEFISELNVGTYYVFFTEDDSHNVSGFTSEKYYITWNYHNPVTINVVQRDIRVVGNTGTTAISKEYDGGRTVLENTPSLIMGAEDSHEYYRFTAVENNDESGVMGRDAGKLMISDLEASYNSKNVVDADEINVEEAVLDGTGAANYRLVNDSFTVPGQITPKPMTVKVKNQSVTYGSPVTSYEFIVEGAIEEDVPAIQTGLNNYELTGVVTTYQAITNPDSGKSHDVGYYPLNVDSTKHYVNSNYTISFPEATGNNGDEFGVLTVEKKQLHYVAKNVFINYGVKEPPRMYDGYFKVDEFVYGDSIATAKEADDYAKILGQGNDGSIKVYTDNNLSVEAEDYRVEFSCNDNANNPVGSTTVAGEYDITATNVEELYTKNYELKASTGILTIGKFYISVEGIQVDSKEYDGTKTVKPEQIDLSNATFRYYEGAVEQIVGYSELSDDFKASFAVTGAYIDKNVSDNSLVNLNVSIIDNSYVAMRYNLLTEENIEEAAENDTKNIFDGHITQTRADSAITPVNVVLAANDLTINYGQMPLASQLNVTGEGFIAGEGMDDIPGFSKSVSYGPEFTSFPEVGTYTIDISSSLPGAGTHGNYNISFATSTLTVVQSTLKAPTAITWNGGIVSWNPVASIGDVDVAGYELVLKKGDTDIAEINTASVSSYDFSETIRENGKGDYTVEIRPISGIANNIVAEAEYANVSEYGNSNESAIKKAVLVTPVFSSDEITSKAIDAYNSSKVYVDTASKQDSYVVIAGESVNLNVEYSWKTIGTDSAEYISGYEPQAFTSNATVGVSTTMTSAALAGHFVGTVSISDEITENEIQVILKLKKSAAQGTLAIAADVDTALYAVQTHPVYSASVTHLEDVGYSYEYEWSYLLNGYSYDKDSGVMDSYSYVENGEVNKVEEPVQWLNQSFTFPRGKRAQDYDVHCNVIATRKDNGESVALQANKIFHIVKPEHGDPASLVVTVHDWTYGEAREQAACVPLFGADMGDVTIYYRAEGEDDDKWSTKLPTDAGSYEVQAKSSGTDSYPAVTSNIKTFEISKAVLEAPTDFEMYPVGGAPYGLLKWNGVNGIQENEGVASESEVTPSYEITVTLAPGTGGNYGADQQLGKFIVDATEANVSSYIDGDGYYKFKIRALANERTEEDGNINCDDSSYVHKNTPIIGVRITADIDGATKEYDGEPITVTASYADGSENYSYKWYKEGVEIPGATGHTYQITDVNESGNYSVRVTSENTGDEPISSKALLCTISKRPVEIIGFAAEKIYDNEPLTFAGNYSVASNNLTDSMYTASYAGSKLGEAMPFLTGQSLTGLGFEGEITDVGEADNTPKNAVVTEGSIDKSDNYEFTYVPGVLKVTKKSAIVTAPTAEKIYDGNPLVAVDGTTVDGIFAGQSLSAAQVTVESTITNVGEIPNVIDLSTVRIYDNNRNKDVTNNYTFTKVDGSLKVTKANIAIQAENCDFIYDGLAKSCYASVSTNSPTEVFKGAAFKYSIITLDDENQEVISSPADSIELVHAGQYKVRIYLAESDNHLAATPVDVTVTINRRPLVIKGATKSKLYDGLPHTLSDNEYEIVEDTALVTGDTIKSIAVSNPAVARRVGEVEESTVDNAVIKNSANETVTGDYLIEYRAGELSITKRHISIEAKNQVKTYDGQALTIGTMDDLSGINPTDNNYYAIGGDGLAEGDELLALTISGSQTDYGTSNATPSNALIKSGNVDVTGCYDISYEGALLKVNKRSITIKPKTYTKVYDGVAAVYNGSDYDEDYVHISGENLGTGDYIESVTLEGEILNVGEETLIPSAAVIRNGGKAVTDNYNITYQNGILKVTPAIAVITVGTDSKVYDGTPLTYQDKDFATKNGMLQVTGLVGEDVLSDITLTGSITNVGECDAVASLAKVSKGNLDVTGNYSITYEKGSLKVTKRIIKVKADDSTGMYGGAVDTNGFTYTIVEGSEVREGDAKIKLQCAATENSTIGDYEIIPVTSGNNYQVIPETGTYTIVKRPITLKAADKTVKYYPNIKLESNEVEVTNGNLAGNDKIAAINADGTIATVGETDNNISDAIILKGVIDVTGNYDISYEKGKLLIEKGVQEIIAEDMVIVYDGKPHSVKDIPKALKYQVADGQIIVEAELEEITSVGEIPVVLKTEETDLFEAAVKAVILRIVDKPASGNDSSNSGSGSYPAAPPKEDSQEIKPDEINNPLEDKDSSTRRPKGNGKAVLDSGEKATESGSEAMPPSNTEAPVEGEDNSLSRYIVDTVAEDVLGCQVVGADIQDMLDKLLSDEDKEKLSNGDQLRFRVEVKMNEYALPNEFMTSVNKKLTSSDRILGTFDSGFFVKIGDNDETKINQDYSSVSVEFTLPDEIWENVIVGYSQILRTYLDENGEYVTEVAVDKITDKSLVMDIDNYSSYSVTTGSLQLLDQDDCFIHWLILAMMLLSIISIMLYYRRRKKHAQEEAIGEGKHSRIVRHYLVLILFNGIGLILVFFGSCEWDVIAEASSVIITILLEYYKSRRFKKYIEKLRNEALENHAVQVIDLRTL